MEESLRSALIARTTRAVVAILVLLIGAGVGALLIWTAPMVAPASLTGEAPQVVVLEARPIPVQRQWQGYGTAEAKDSANVPVRVTATVERIPPEVLAGATVTRGQTLAQFEASDFQRQVEIAEQNVIELEAQLQMLAFERQRLTAQIHLEHENVATWEAEFKRVQALVNQGAGKPREVEVAQRSLNAARTVWLQVTQALDNLEPQQAQLLARLEAQRASLALAQLNLQRCTVTSPLDGLLQAVDVEVGENLTAGQRVARVVNLTIIEIPLRLPAAARMSVRLGNRVDLRPTHAGDYQWSGSIVRIAPENDPTMRTMTVFVEFDQHDLLREEDPNAATLLRPGLFVEGVVTTDAVSRQWVVPRRSLRAGRILVVEDGILRSESVQVAYTLAGVLDAWALPDRQWAVLEQPLADGLLVVLNGSTSLRVGQPVRPVPVSAKSADEAATQSITPAGRLEDQP